MTDDVCKHVTDIITYIIYIFAYLNHLTLFKVPEVRGGS